MSTTDTNNFDTWENSLDDKTLERTEQHLVHRHSGDFCRVPESVSAGLLGFLMEQIERDIREGTIDQETHSRFVYAAQLDNAVNDHWNGYHD